MQRSVHPSGWKLLLGNTITKLLLLPEVISVHLFPSFPLNVGTLSAFFNFILLFVIYWWVSFLAAGHLN